MEVHLSDQYKSITEIFSLFSSNDSIKIFLHAEKGIDASSSSILRREIPEKTYYSRLKKLLQLGLIEKVNGRYIHTTFGEIIYNKLLVPLPSQVKKIEQYKIVDALKHSKIFSPDEITNFLSKILNEPLSNKDIKNSTYDPINNSVTKIRLYFLYEKMIPELYKAIELSSYEILVATRIFDEKLFNAIFHKAKSGLRVKVLCDENLIKKYHETYDESLKSKDVKHFADRLKIIENPWLNDENLVERRINKVPFGFIILDENTIGFELINQYQITNFYAGMLVKDEIICNRMKKFYDELWSLESIR